MKRVLFYLLFSFIFVLFPHHAFADDKFSTNADTTYTVSENGTTHVAMQATIQNTTSNYYVTTYSLQVGYTDITNLKASDPNGAIIPVIQKTQDGEIINLTFNSIVYGQGTKLPFNLSFDTNTIAHHNGNVWEVDIPGLSNLNDFADFTVHVVVPQSFGSPTYIKPEQATNALTFSKDQLGKSGISLAFGKNQSYDYSLLYHLKNSNLFPVKTEIALPPTTNYQQVAIDSLTPKPINVVEDRDGNWMASYSLMPSQTLTVVEKGTIFVSLYPTDSPLSSSERALYLKPSPYWQTTDPQIQSLARELKTPENIYNYVVDHLTYNYARVNNNQTRFGAVGILQNPTQAVCLEFTDLFVALARAAGIPAREIDGYGYTQNTKERPISQTEDILHAWPEYYDGQKWVMVDPTWGNTTGGVDYFHILDFDHIAFSIKGVSPDYPVPAGGYKIPGQQTGHDIAISLSQNQPPSKSTVQAAILLNNSYFSALPIQGNLYLSNSGSILFPSQTVVVSASSLLPNQQDITTPSIPPFGNATIPFSFHKTPFLTNKTEPITIALNGKTYTKSIHIITFSPQQLIIGGITIGILSIIIFVLATGSWRLSILRPRE